MTTVGHGKWITHEEDCPRGRRMQLVKEVFELSLRAADPLWREG